MPSKSEESEDRGKKIEEKRTKTYQMRPQHHHPRQKPTHRRQVQKPPKHNPTPLPNAHKRQAGQTRRTQQRHPRHPIPIAPPQEPRRLPLQTQAVQTPTARVQEPVRRTPLTDQDDGVDDVVETADAGSFDAEDEGGSGGRCAATGDSAQEVWVVGRDEDGDDEGAEDVEEYEAKNESSRGLWDVRARRLAFPGRQGDEFRSHDECETGSDERGPEGQESAQVPQMRFRVGFEGAAVRGWQAPVSETQPVVVGPAAEEEDDAEDEEGAEGEDLEAADPEFGFAVVGDGDDVEEDDGEDDEAYPDCSWSKKFFSHSQLPAHTTVLGQGKKGRQR